MDAVERGRLQGHALAWDSRSRRRGRFAGDLTPDVASDVDGGLRRSRPATDLELRATDCRRCRRRGGRRRPPLARRAYDTSFAEVGVGQNPPTRSSRAGRRRRLRIRLRPCVTNELCAPATSREQLAKRSRELCASSIDHQPAVAARQVRRTCQIPPPPPPPPPRWSSRRRLSSPSPSHASNDSLSGDAVHHGQRRRRATRRRRRSLSDPPFP